VRELALVNAMLEASGLEEGQVRVERTEVDVAELLEELKQETSLAQRQQPLHFEWQVAPALPRLRTDRTKLKAILQHVLSNAVKFTAQGCITIAVRPQEDGVECCIGDTGIGMTPEAVAVIFEPFVQVDGSARRQYGGAGLGLHLVKRLLELLGGRVTVESEMGQGSTFRVWVPRAPGPSQEEIL
jgi:signal transduction histidine kinase